MANYLIIGIIALTVVFLMIFLRNKVVKQNNKPNIWRILSYVFLLLLLGMVFLAPEQKVIVYILLGASLLTFGINQYKLMKQYGGKTWIWFIPLMIALLVAILFIVIKLVDKQPT